MLTDIAMLISLKLQVIRNLLKAHIVGVAMLQHKLAPGVKEQLLLDPDIVGNINKPLTKPNLCYEGN